MDLMRGAMIRYGACGLLLSGIACSTPVASSPRVAHSAPPASAAARMDGGDAGSPESALPTTSDRECEPGAARYDTNSFCVPQICRKDGRWSPALALFCQARAYFEPGSSVLQEKEPWWLLHAVKAVVTGAALEVTGIVPRGSARNARAQALAQKRAEVVRDLLIERGAPANRLSVVVIEALPGFEAEQANGTEFGAALVVLPETAAPPP